MMPMSTTGTSKRLFDASHENGLVTCHGAYAGPMPYRMLFLACLRALSTLQLLALLRKELAQEFQWFLWPAIILVIARLVLELWESYSVVTKCFIASSKCGVTCAFKYCRAGAPCSVACTGI